MCQEEPAPGGLVGEPTPSHSSWPSGEAGCADLVMAEVEDGTGALLRVP